MIVAFVLAGPISTPADERIIVCTVIIPWMRAFLREVFERGAPGVRA